MSPIDDELRTALSSRTDHVELSPDFFTGVERRARGLRRRKVAATVAGSALAVSALGIGTPIAASLFDGTTGGSVADNATPAAVLPYALDPAAPWAYRGDPLPQGAAETTAREWATAHGVAEEDVDFAPLYGETSSGETVLFFVADAPDDAPRWGVATSGHAGPVLLLDEPLAAGSRALPWAVTTGEGDRLLVVAAPGTTLQYGADSATEWRAMEPVEDGVGATDLDGDQAEDRIQVLDPDGEQLTTIAAPSPTGALEPAPEDEGPGTDTPLDVDDAPYALDVDAPWSYRGPAELTQHPDLASADQRLFEQGGEGRTGDAWSQTPLLAVERPDGLSVLMVLHRSGDEAYVTTTWQKQDEAARQSEQPVQDGTLVVQSFLPQTDGTGVLVALAAPRTGAVETDVRALEQVHNEQGYGVWLAPAEVPAGELFLYSEGDGLLYHSEPLRRS